MFPPRQENTESVSRLLVVMRCVHSRRQWFTADERVYHLKHKKYFEVYNNRSALR